MITHRQQQLLQIILYGYGGCFFFAPGKRVPMLWPISECVCGKRVIDKIAKREMKKKTGLRKLLVFFLYFGLSKLTLFRSHFFIRFLANVSVFIAQNNVAAAVAVTAMYKNIRNYLCYYCDSDIDSNDDHQLTASG